MYTLQYYLIERQAPSEKHVSLIDSRHNRPGFCFVLFQLSDLVKIILIALYQNKAMILQKLPRVLVHWEVPSKSTVCGASVDDIRPPVRLFVFLCLHLIMVKQ